VKQETSRSWQQALEDYHSSILVNKMARRLEGNIGKYAGVERVTTRGEYREVSCGGERNNWKRI
jgi:hypothetical protein